MKMHLKDHYMQKVIKERGWNFPEGWNHSYCGYAVKNATSNESLVTCKRCLNKMERRRY